MELRPIPQVASVDPTSVLDLTAHIGPTGSCNPGPSPNKTEGPMGTKTRMPKLKRNKRGWLPKEVG